MNNVNFQKNINKLSKQEQLEIIKNDPYPIRYIKNPTIQIQLEAINYDPYTIRFIKNPKLKVIIFINKSKYINSNKSFITKKPKLS